MVDGCTPSASASTVGRWAPRLASTTNARYCGNVTARSTAASDRTATATNTREARNTASTTSDASPEHSCIPQVLHTALIRANGAPSPSVRHHAAVGQYHLAGHEAAGVRHEE